MAYESALPTFQPQRFPSASGRGGADWLDARGILQQDSVWIWMFLASIEVASAVENHQSL